MAIGDCYVGFLTVAGRCEVAGEGLVEPAGEGGLDLFDAPQAADDGDGVHAMARVLLIPDEQFDLESLGLQEDAPGITVPRTTVDGRTVPYVYRDGKLVPQRGQKE